MIVIPVNVATGTELVGSALPLWSVGVAAVHVEGRGQQAKACTTQIWETLKSTYINKCGVSGCLLARVAQGLVEIGQQMLLALSSMILITPHIY